MKEHSGGGHRAVAADKSNHETPSEVTGLMRVTPGWGTA